MEQRGKRDPDELLQKTAAAITLTASPVFWETFVSCLADALNVDWALVGKLVAGQQRHARTLAAWHRDRITPNFEYQCETDPESNLQFGSMRVHLDGGHKQFRSTWLKRVQPERFGEVFLVDSIGRACGVLAIAHREQFVHTELMEPALQIFAFKAAIELERELADADSYRDLLQTLKGPGAASESLI